MEKYICIIGEIKMPELPEVETIKRVLSLQLEGETIESIEILNAGVRICK